MTLTHLTRPSRGEPEGLLVLFHGRGADERDLFPLLDALDPRTQHVEAQLPAQRQDELAPFTHEVVEAPGLDPVLA